MVELILSLFKPDTVFSFTFFLMFLGLGWFLNFALWPWLKAYLDNRQKLNHELRLAELEIERKRQERWDTVITTLGEFKQELGAFREKLDVIISYFIAELMKEDKL